MRTLLRPRVKSGLDLLAEDPGLLARLWSDHARGAGKSLRAGLVANPAALSADFRRPVEIVAAAMVEAGGSLVRLFGPEHGFYGEAQAGVAVPDGIDRRTGLPVHSLYGTSHAPEPGLLEDLDILLADLPDVGLRFFTYRSTLALLVKSLSELRGKTGRAPLLIVLDRPNPLGGRAVEGLCLEPGYESFVGAFPTPTRCGLSLGEFVRLAQAATPCDLAILPCEGWRRGDLFPETGLPWIMPSPNLPSFESLLAYAATCLIEGTNVSEGRGTTRPFEIFGAPGIDPEELAARLEARRLPGLRFRPLFFRPSFSKHAGELCGGVQMHPVDPSAYRSAPASFAVLSELRASWPDFRFLEPGAPGRRPFIDLLTGGPLLSSGLPEAELQARAERDSAAFRSKRAKLLLYPEDGE